MKQVKLKCGIIFVDTVEEVLNRGDGFINFEDSNHHYIGRYALKNISDYTGLEPKNIQKELDAYLTDMHEFTNPTELGNWLSENFVYVSKDLLDICKKAIKLGYFYQDEVKLIQEKKSDKIALSNILLKNDWINKIGNFYILVEN